MPRMVVVELGKPPPSPTFIFGHFGKFKLTVGLFIRDVGIDNDDPLAYLRHQIEEFVRLIQVVQEATAKNYIEDTILGQVVDIITRERQVGEIGRRFDALTIVKIALPDLDAQRIETSTRQFDGIATLETAKINKPFPSDALRKQYPQESLGELEQHQIFHLPGLLRLRQRSVVKPDVVRCEAARHDFPFPT